MKKKKLLVVETMWSSLAIFYCLVILKHLGNTSISMKKLVKSDLLFKIYLAVKDKELGRPTDVTACQTWLFPEL